MNYLIYLFLGVLQGITEPLPISSSGHLFLFKNLFNTNMFNDLNFEIVVNFGSFIAIFFIFYKDIIMLIKSFFNFILKKEDKKKYANNFRYCMLIIIGTLPVGIAGIFLKDFIEETLARTWILGICFIITAISLFLVKNIKGNKDDYDITYKDALIIGLFQVIALTPGISRSGSVLVACLLCNLKRDTALKYTFMLYFPVSIASMILGIKDLIEVSNLSSLIFPYTLGMIAAGIVTYFSYQWLSDWVKKGKLWKFSIYCLLLGIFVLIYFR
ncbi:MAG: undecaprenyl-diphosphate phosphatase [Firmicutes bacterium]|nr:undecaprenyl-diphosphate phosphatase [Bacillota bacterium]